MAGFFPTGGGGRRQASSPDVPANVAKALMEPFRHIDAVVAAPMARDYRLPDRSSGAVPVAKTRRRMAVNLHVHTICLTDEQRKSRFFLNRMSPDPSR